MSVKRYRSAALGALPVCAHWAGPDVVLASDYDSLAQQLAQHREDTGKDAHRLIGEKMDALALLDAQALELQGMREALGAIKAKCATPALKSYQHEAVLFAYRTADAALKPHREGERR